MVDVNRWLQVKYAQQQQAIDNHGMEAAAQANWANTRARLAPQELAGQLAVQQANINNTAAQTQHQKLLNGINGMRSPMEILTDFASTHLNYPRGGFGTPTPPSPGGMLGDMMHRGQNKMDTGMGAGRGSFASPFASSQGNLSDGSLVDPDPMYRGGLSLHYSTGTAQVPGVGDGTVDTVDAKLAPKEAVLNRAAADLLGRDTIEAFNKVGQHLMGMGMGGEQAPAPAKAPAKGKKGFVKGTSSVPQASTPDNHTMLDMLVGMKLPPSNGVSSPGGGHFKYGNSPAESAQGSSPAERGQGKTPGYRKGTASVEPIRDSRYDAGEGGSGRGMIGFNTPGRDGERGGRTPTLQEQPPTVGQAILHGLAEVITREPLKLNKPTSGDGSSGRGESAKTPGYRKGTSSVPAKKGMPPAKKKAAK